jgi:DNA repair and recombination protein RAD52
MFSESQKKLLSAPLSASHIKTRKQAGRDLSYIEGWHVIAEANRIFGFDGWTRETVDLAKLGEPREVDGKWRVAFMARARITVITDDSHIVREGCGYGSGIDRDVGSAHESALKEAETDAMKRALMTFGNPFGLALYDKDQANVEHEKPTPAPDKALEWQRATLALLSKMTGIREIREWEQAPANDKAMKKLAQERPDLHRELVGALGDAYERLNPIAAE